MPILKEITDLLRHWDVWRKVEEAPARIDALEIRLAALEEALTRCPAEGCPYCGARAWRLKEVFMSSLEARGEIWACAECGKSDKRWIPSGRKPPTVRKR